MARPGQFLIQSVRVLLGGWLCAAVAAAQVGAPDPATVAGAPLRPAGDPVRLEVRAGWGHLRVGEEQRWVTRRDGALSVQDGFFLELGSDADVELSWSGSASIRLTGPAGVFVDPVSGPLGGRSVGFRRLATAEIEVRRGALGVTLPRGQRLHPQASTFRLEGHPGGVVDLFHRAGRPLELDIGSRYTFPLVVGTRRRLPECVAPVLETPPTTRGRAPGGTPPSARR